MSRWVSPLVKRAHDEIRRTPEVVRVHPVPSSFELDVARKWLLHEGVESQAVVVAVTAAVDGMIKDDRDWLDVFQGFVNRAVRENATAYREFNGEWLRFRATIHAVRNLVTDIEELEEWRGEAHA